MIVFAFVNRFCLGSIQRIKEIREQQRLLEIFHALAPHPHSIVGLIVIWNKNILSKILDHRRI